MSAKHMTTDCFGNATPGIPPSISDTFADIRRYAHIPIAERLNYHNARIEAMIGNKSAAEAWNLYRAIATRKVST